MVNSVPWKFQGNSASTSSTVVAAGSSRNNLTQPQARFHAVGFGCLQRRVDDRTGVRIGRSIREQSCFPANYKRPDDVLATVVVNRQIATFGGACQATPVFLQVRQRRIQRTLGRYTRQRLVEPGTALVHFKSEKGQMLRCELTFAELS